MSEMLPKTAIAAIEAILADKDGTIDRLRAENARLREALHAVGFMAEGAIRMGLTDELRHIKETAERALADDNKKDTP